MLTQRTYQYLKNLIGIGLLIILQILPTIALSQTDSTKKDLKFDFGLTRDQNINLWPIYKRTISKTQIDKQLLFPLYRNYKNLLTSEKRSHILPFYWSDSSKYFRNLRVLSLYYPSLIHFSNNYRENTKTFTFIEIAPRINFVEFKRSPDGLLLQNNLLFFLWYKNNQITQRSHLVVFPLYWQFSSPLRKTSTLFPFCSFGKYDKFKKEYFAITPLFWHFGSQKRNSNLLFPIWWNRNLYMNSDTIRNNLVFPVYYSHTDNNTQNKVLFPIIWNFKNNRYRSFTLAPLVSVGKSYNNTRKHLIITPLFWQLRREEGQSITVFPILWQNRWKTKFDDYRSLIIFPVFWNYKNNNSRSTVIPPFIWSKTTPNYKSLSFIPLISKGNSPDNSLGHLAITPFFWHTYSHKGFSNILFPIWFFQKKFDGNDVKVKNVVFPLYWGWNSSERSGSILFPFLWRFCKPNYKSISLIPFFSHGEKTDKSSSYTAITPFYWKFKTISGNGQLLFPLWFEKQKNDNGEIKSKSQVILLYWKYKDTERKHQGLFPLAWSFKNHSRSSFTLFPLLMKGQNLQTSKSYYAITPLYWHFNKPNKTLNTFFPIWWNYSDNSSNNNKRLNLLFPIYFSHTDTLKIRRILFPVLWRFKNPAYSSFTFIPFISHGKTPNNSIHHLAITPLFWNFKNSNGSTTTLLPFFWHSKYGEGELTSKKTIFFPVYFDIVSHDTQNKILFPFIWNLSNSKYWSLTVAPLFSYGRNNDKSRSHYVITPLYYNIKNTNSSTQILIPIWYSLSKLNQTGFYQANVIFPIYWSIKNKNKLASVVFPLVWSFKGASSNSFTFFPLFSKGQTKNGLKHLAITPLFWKLEDNFMRKTIAFPFFTKYDDNANNKKFDILFFLFRKQKDNDEKRFSVLWPIIECEKKTNYKYFRFAPLVWSKQSKEFNYFTIQPIYYRSWSKNHSTQRFFWGLYVQKRTFGVKTSNRILWQLVKWNKYNNGDKEFRVLHLLFANSKVNGKTEKSLFPIYYLTRDNNGNKSLSVMLYFYNSLKRHVPNTTEYYQEERIFLLIRIRSNYRMLKQKGIELN